MENIIRLLPDHISNQIAAGEVIQRPASVVKELAENAIDAGADSIEIYIKQAGKSSIKILDNGCGISVVDTKMAFERHATSKISNADDLFDLHTKGFRGEALASVASIAHVEMKTKRAQDELGTLVINEGGEIKSQEPVVCNNGTSIEVKNLFFNVPARRNFLKSDTIEFKHIEEEFLRIALIHTSISISLFHNDKPLYQLSAANVRKRLVDIFGRSMNDKLIPVKEDTEIVKINGFVVKPEFAKKSRGQQYFFVNDRFFKDNYLHNAVTRAFGNLIVNNTYPGYFINFSVNPARIDVNVHPTKTEIKFEFQKDIYMILNSAIKQALGKFNIFPTLDFETETAFDLPYNTKYEQPIEPKIKVDPTYNPFTKYQSNSGISTKSDSNYAHKSLHRLGFGNESMDAEEWKNFYQIEDDHSNTEGPKELGAELHQELAIDFSSIDLLLANNIALIHLNRQFLAIDVSRASERVIFDELLRTFFVQQVASQTILFPLELEITPREKTTWEENKITISRLGFQWQFERDLLIVSGVSAILAKEEISKVVKDVKEILAAKDFDKNDLAHLLINTIAFANSRNRAWTKDSVRLILQDWWECKDKWQTPDGMQIARGWGPQELINKI